MADIKQIRSFAIKWYYKFINPNIKFIELVDHWFADDCVELGFEMDCGQAFSKKYGEETFGYKALNEIIDDVTDINLLGSAIYSQWRYFNHWAYSGEEILKPENRAWFLLALSRLALLTGENLFIFKGTLKKVHIISNNVFYGDKLKLDTEEEQHLTISSDGCVSFSSYNSVNKNEQYRKLRAKNFNIEKSATEKLFNAISMCFANEYYNFFAEDVGNWVMELTNTEGVTYKFCGTLCANFYYQGIELSDLVRDTLGMNDLYVFDGNKKPDIINKITLDYNRLTKIKSKQMLESDNSEYIIWNYTEHLIIDRKTETIEHIQNIGTGCKVSHKYEVKDGISKLLDFFDANDFFLNIKGNEDDVVDNPNEKRNYKITIDYKKTPQRVIEGSFDKNGLPDDFADFAESIIEFIYFYGLGEILNKSVYSKVKRRKSEYIFCSVKFDYGYKSYYYITDDESINIGDYVLVPVGKDNHEDIVKVVNIEYFSQDNAPIPIEKTKRIISKFTSDDIFDNYREKIK